VDQLSCLLVPNFDCLVLAATGKVCPSWLKVTELTMAECPEGCGSTLCRKFQILIVLSPTTCEVCPS